MNQYDVSGILRTYSEKARHAKDKEQLKDIIRNSSKNWICVRLILIS